MMREAQIAARVEGLLAEPIRAAGCRLLEVQFQPGRKSLLRLVVDKEPGVSLDDLSAISELAGRLLDVEDPIAQAYTLEVSSPGLFRPLREKKHFEQSLGKTARIKLAQDCLPERKERTLRGVIAAVADEALELHVDGETVVVPLGGVTGARLDPEL